MSNAPSTLKAYAHAWKNFSNWCSEVGRAAMPASTETVADFVTWGLYERPRRYRLETIKLALTAIARQHLDSHLSSPVTRDIRELVHNAARDLRERKRCKAALEPEQLRRICRWLTARESVIAKRDRAMFLLQFAAGWRRSEIVTLELHDVRFTPRGFEVLLGASKTDQTGEEGRAVPIDYGDYPETCPVEALRVWLEVRGKWPGSLFCRLTHGRVEEHGITGETVNERLQAALAAIEENPRAYGSHSLRAGMVTAGIENGASETMIMLRTGQKSLNTMRRYVRPALASRANPLKGVL